MLSNSLIAQMLRNLFYMLYCIYNQGVVVRFCKDAIYEKKERSFKGRKATSAFADVH